MDGTTRLPERQSEAAPLQHFPAQTAQTPGSLLLLPALGVPAHRYTRCATLLSEAGISVTLMEWRGVGDSPLRASRSCDFGFAELLDADIPAALRGMREAAPEAPLWIMGHSLGGHLAAITAGRLQEVVDGLILVACGSPWLAAYAGPTRRRIRLLCALIPVCNTLLGYFPGDRIRFGGRQPRRLMRDWRRLALTGGYRAEGVEEDLEAGLARYAGRVLSLRMAEDAFAPAAAVRAVTGKLAAADLQEAVIDAAELGQPADHFRWAKQPDAVVRRVMDWCALAAEERAA
jgi:predicted alpha/beta hydrolase